jgi:hypothetical protein
LGGVVGLPPDGGRPPGGGRAPQVGIMDEENPRRGK